MKVSLPVFFYIWAERQRWEVPDIHWQALHWLESKERVAVLRCFRGFGKSTLLAIYNAWRYYQNPEIRILHQSESDGTAYKTSRDTRNVLRNHPLTKGLLPSGKGTVEQWWVTGSKDSRNASMFARGILSNVTSSRADECQNDDVEVPRNIQTPEARTALRYRLGEQTHILVPGGSKLFIGTPHTHDSLYDELERKGADCLTIKMFRDERRYTANGEDRYSPGFKPEFVFIGVGEGCRLLEEGNDYRITGGNVVFAEPLYSCVIDMYAGSAWPERFNRDELLLRRKETNTLNEWDSQYQLHAKPVSEVRLDPDRILEYSDEPRVIHANRSTEMWLGNVRIIGASAHWDVATGKIGADASVLSVVFTDANGHLYWHECEELMGDLAVFDGHDRISGGQVVQVRDIVRRHNLPRVTVEVNGPGSFAGKLLRQALKGINCAVVEEFSVVNKQKRILDSFEAPITSGFLWANTRVLDGKAYTQLRDFNPKLKNQPDDFIDSAAGAISGTPVRIGNSVTALEKKREDWRPLDSTSFNVKDEY